ncbi:MAG: glycoside hydrolase family 88 protein [Myxococcaceae bacterium]
MAALLLFGCGLYTPPARAVVDRTAVIEVAKRQLQRTVTLLPDVNHSPKATLSNGTWTTVSNTEPIGWTQGFFPGSLWKIYDATRDPAWRDLADQWTRPLEVQKTNTQTHDLGFKLFIPFEQAYRLTGNDYYRQVLLTAAASLVTRYNATAGMISTGDWNPSWKLPLVIDTMMNLELLLWASENGGAPEWKDLALQHALTTLRDAVRDDGGTFHVVDYEPGTGAVRLKQTFQGYADGSTWSRGQAWAIYGFYAVYKYTQDPRMLAAANRVTDYYLARLPANGVPNWDFDAPHALPDSSAAAAVASVLLDRPEHKDRALQMLETLAAPPFLASPSGTQPSILMHAVGHLPANQEIDVGLVYGDYYFVEALVKLPPTQPVPDAGQPGTPDAGTPDAGTPDAGMPDAGQPGSGEMPGAPSPGRSSADGGVDPRTGLPNETPSPASVAIQKSGCASVLGLFPLSGLLVGLFAHRRIRRHRA